jgi:hypothetical protein
MDGRYDATAYEDDFYAWTQRQAAALRAEAASGANAPIDWENVAEEIESMGNSQRDKIESHLEILLIHLLKWLYCPDLRERCERGWSLTIMEQRRRIARVIKKNPSLKRAPGELLNEIYEDARALAAGEADTPLKTFPQEPPFTIEQALDPRYPADLFSRDEEA